LIGLDQFKNTGSDIIDQQWKKAVSAHKSYWSRSTTAHNLHVTAWL